MISVFMPTWGRIGMVDEAVHSFLIQDYPDKELIIVNDHPNITLVSNYGEVKIHNIRPRFATLGEKLNYGATVANGSHLMQMNDDDILLPWALRMAMEQLKDRDMVFEFRGYFVLTDGAIADYKPDSILTGSIMTKSAYAVSGGFPHVDSCEDVGFVNKANRMKRLLNKRMPRQWSWVVLRRDTAIPHMMQYPEDTRYEELRKIGMMNYPKPITHIIEPHWKRDYVELTRNFINGTDPRHLG